MPASSPSSHPRRLPPPVILLALAALIVAIAATAAAPAVAGPGEAVWSKRFSSNSRGDVFSSVARGPNRSVYVAGVTKATKNVSTMVVAKYRDDGATARRLWLRTYRWPGRVGSEAVAIAVDRSGNAVVAGSIGASPLATARGRDIIVLKYSASGKRRWAWRYDGPRRRDDYATGLALDTGGNAYVVGASRGAGTGLDYVAFRFRADGKPLWTVRYGGTSWDEGKAIAVDGKRNAYVTGSSNRGGTSSAATLKISPSGKRNWVKRVRVGSGDAHGNAIALSRSGGSVYIGGGTEGSASTKMNMLVTKLSATTGARSWAKTIHATGIDIGFDLAVDRSGNAVCVGDTTAATGVTHGLIARLTAAGSLSWTREVWLEKPDNKGHLQAVAASGLGKVYAGGSGTRTGSADDFLVQHVLADGSDGWTMWRNGSASAKDWCRDLVLEQSAVYAVGRTTSKTGRGDALLVKIRR